MQLREEERIQRPSLDLNPRGFKRDHGEWNLTRENSAGVGKEG